MSNLTFEPVIKFPHPKYSTEHLAPSTDRDDDTDSDASWDKDKWVKCLG